MINWQWLFTLIPCFIIGFWCGLRVGYSIGADAMLDHLLPGRKMNLLKEVINK
jgi:hypothetical protein